MSSTLIVVARRDKSLTHLRERCRAHFTSASTINWRCARVTSERLSWGSLTPHTNTRDSPAESTNGTSPAPYHELSYHFILRHVKSSFTSSVIRRALLYLLSLQHLASFKQPAASFCLLYLRLKSLKSFLPVSVTETSKTSLMGVPIFLFWTSLILKLEVHIILWHYHQVIRGCNQHSSIPSFNSPSYFNFVYLNVMFFSIEAIYLIVGTKVNILRLWGFLVADRHLHSIQHHNSADFCHCFYKCSSLNLFLNYFLTTCIVLCFCNSFFNSALSLFAVIFACKTALQRLKSHSLCKKRALWLYFLHQ